MGRRRGGKSHRFFKDLHYRMECCKVLARKWWWTYVWRKGNIMIFKTDCLDNLSRDGKAVMIVDCLHREVITILIHPSKGKTCLSRTNININWLENFFRNPRTHTQHHMQAHYLTMSDVENLLENIKLE